jgi:small redox-active disulfide protein 2
MSVSIKVLGTGCSRCKSLEKATREAVAELKLDASVEKVEDIKDILGYGVMQSPALIINEKIALTGRVPGVEELKKIIQKNL